MRRHRALQDHAQHVAVVVHRQQSRFALLLTELAWPRLLFEVQTHLSRRTRLAACVDGRRVMSADADRDQPADLMRCRSARDLFGDLAQYPVADGPAIQESIVCHGKCPLWIELWRDRTAR